MGSASMWRWCGSPAGAVGRETRDVELRDLSAGGAPVGREGEPSVDAPVNRTPPKLHY